MANNPKISALLDFYGEMLTEKQRTMVEYYYNDDLSLGEISENEGITRQGVRDAVKRAEVQLLELEEKIGAFARVQEMSQALEKIRELASDINARNSRFSGDREIMIKSLEISSIAENLTE